MFVQGLSERYRRIGRGGDDFVLPMSRDEIARYLGLVLETVSRGFSRLHEDGIIDVHGRRVRILNQAGLRAITQGCESHAPPQRRRHAD
jgi:CRP/FNR family transcriptional regulator